MRRKWCSFGFGLSLYGLLIFLFEMQPSFSLNQEGMDLLEFRASIEVDPFGAFANWNLDDAHPCIWLGVHCVDGKVHMLDLGGCSLEGRLAPELGKLVHLRSIVLYKNRFAGSIPKEFYGLQMLEVLDLRHNSLSGSIPEEINKMVSLKRLLLGGNNFEGKIPPQLREFNSLAESSSYDQNLSFALAPKRGCGSRKFGNCIWNSISLQLKNAKYIPLPIKAVILQYLDISTSFGTRLLYNSERNMTPKLSTDLSEQSIIKRVHHVTKMVRRKLFEVSRNLPATPAIGFNSSEQMMSPITISSGSFPAVMTQKNSPSAPSRSSWSPWRVLHFFLVSCVVLLVSLLIMLCTSRNRGGSRRVSGLSTQLQKALITGVPKLNRTELESACEDFSNVLGSRSGCTIYKGTLSSGVEIAVASTTVSSYRNWSRHAEMTFRNKLQVLSRLNHKNFVNLLGYCSEDKPFMRMMVFEYAPNGNLYEHLHVKEGEHLDWNSRVRIIMGMAYCLQHMHHELIPPMIHPDLQSSSIFLTDDYAAKIAEIGFWMDIVGKSKIRDEEGSESSLLRHGHDSNDNIYSFGMMLLEIICGKVPYDKEEGSLLKWAAEYWNDKRRMSYMVDTKLKSFKNKELDVICDVIQECINPEPSERPSMREIISKLRQVIMISPESATPKLSPIWWAELEILSIEAS